MLIEIDLRGTPCPTNYVRCCLALEKLKDNQTLQVDVDRGEPEEMIIQGLKKKGYQINIILQKKNWIRLLIEPYAIS